MHNLKDLFTACLGSLPAFNLWLVLGGWRFIVIVNGLG